MGGINIPGLGPIPISDALKDAFKANDFMTLKTRVDFMADLSDTLDAQVTLLAGPESNQINSPFAYYEFGSPIHYSGNGLMDTVQVDQAWVKWQTQFITPVEVTVGKVYDSRGQGLLFDNNQEAIKALELDWTAGDWSWGAMFGMLDREQFWARSTGGLGLPALSGLSMYSPGVETSGQDNYNLYWLDWAFAGDWKLGTTFLDSGFNQESGWSADLKGTAWGLDWYGEYAQLLSWPTGDDFADWNADGVEDPGETPLADSDTAWLAGLKWKSGFVNITGEYGQVDAGYAFAIPGAGWSAVNPYFASSMGLYSDYLNLPLSRLHPNAEVDPHDINWVDRPLFLDATNIARGWHVNVCFPELLGKDTPLSISYMDGDAYTEEFLGWLGAGGSSSEIAEPDEWRDADAVWTVKLARQFNPNLSANIIYGRREVDNVMSPGTVPAIEDEEDLFAGDDPIQVIRAEVCVAF
jgi:hypothetical protein